MLQWLFRILLLCIFSIDNSEGDTCKKDVFGVSTYKSCPEPDDPASYKYCCGPSWGRFCCDRPLRENKVILEFGPTTQVEQGKDLNLDGDLDGMKDSHKEEKVVTAGQLFENTIGEGKKKPIFSSQFRDFDDDFDDDFEGIGKLIGIVVGSIFVIAFLFLVGCCCIPCCFLAKRRKRTRGMVHNPAGTLLAQALYPTQPRGAPIQSHPPPQPYPYTQHPAYPQYPTQSSGYLPQPYTDAGGPPPGYPAQPPPYPGPPSTPQPYAGPSQAEKQPAFNPNSS